MHNSRLRQSLEKSAPRCLPAGWLLSLPIITLLLPPFFYTFRDVAVSPTMISKGATTKQRSVSSGSLFLSFTIIVLYALLMTSEWDSQSVP